MRDVLFDCTDVIKIYESARSGSKIPALRGVDLTIKEGDLIAIIGPSGAGKTSLVKIMGMLDRQSSGEINLKTEFGMIDYSKTKFSDLLKLRSRLFGFIFQQPGENLFYHLTAWRNVMFPMKAIGMYSREERKRRSLELLEMLDISRIKKQKPSTMSGGQAQRLGVCVALSKDPPIVFADEPTGELDSLNSFKLIRYFRELNSELGKTFIVVTHDHRFQAMTDTVYRIQDGRVATMQKSTVLSREREDFVYVSDDGTLQIPANMRKEYGIERTAKIERAKDHIKIIHLK